MRIQPINMAGISPTKMEKTTSFKGLWGEETSGESYEDRYYSCSTTVKHYYPFSDETDEEINEVVRRNSYEDTRSSNAVIDPITFIDSTIVSVMAALPFSSRDFREYLNDNISKLKSDIIEKHIFSKNLKI